MTRNETRKRINGVEYIVCSFFPENARETAEQKILRLVRQHVSKEITFTEPGVSRSN
jgi:hypothetical protein